jgi:hypothetical protein
MKDRYDKDNTSSQHQVIHNAYYISLANVLTLLIPIVSNVMMLMSYLTEII